MKTEYNLPDELVFEAKAIADRRQTTLEAVIEGALRRDFYGAPEQGAIGPGLTQMGVTPAGDGGSPTDGRFNWIRLGVVAAVFALVLAVAFLLLPNLITVKLDSETNLAIARAEAANMAMVNFIQANGRENAKDQWSRSVQEDRYSLLASYLAFAPSDFTDYMPEGFCIELPPELEEIRKVKLFGPEGNEVLY